MKKQKEPKQETLEEASINYVLLLKENNNGYVPLNLPIKQIFKAGAKWQGEKMYSEEDMIAFAEFVSTYPNKNRNIHHEILHAKSKYDGAERTIDLLAEWFEQFKKK